MYSFELKTVISAPPKQVFAVITEPDAIRKWDYAAWVQSDRRLAGRLRKRDDDGRLTDSEIVVWEPPFRVALLSALPLDGDEEEAAVGTFPARIEFDIEPAEGKSLLTLRATGFPTEDLCARERNSWGGYFLEKLKKIAENH